MTKIREFCNKNRVWLSLILVTLTITAFKITPYSENKWINTSIPIAIGIVLCIICAVFFGAEFLKFDFGSFRQSFRPLKSYIIICTIISVFLTLVPLVAVSEGTMELADNVPLAILYVLFFSFEAGLFEEALFRHTFVKIPLGNEYSIKKVIIYAVTSSFCFGIMHVISDLIGATDLTALNYALAAAKTLQSGLFGFILCIIYLKTKSFWGVVGFHMLNDFLFGISSYLYEKEEVDSYIKGATSSENISALIFMLLNCAILIPALVWSVKTIKNKFEG